MSSVPSADHAASGRGIARDGVYASTIWYALPRANSSVMSCVGAHLLGDGARLGGSAQAPEGSYLVVHRVRALGCVEAERAFGRLRFRFALRLSLRLALRLRLRFALRPRLRLRLRLRFTLRLALLQAPPLPLGRRLRRRGGW